MIFTYYVLYIQNIFYFLLNFKTGHFIKLKHINDFYYKRCVCFYLYMYLIDKITLYILGYSHKSIYFEYNVLVHYKLLMLVLYTQSKSKYILYRLLGSSSYCLILCMYIQQHIICIGRNAILNLLSIRTKSNHYKFHLNRDMRSCQPIFPF